MRQHKIEFIVGLFVTIAILALAFLALRVSGLVYDTGGAGYNVSAAFDNIGDLKIRAPVSIAGVRVGRVTTIKLDPQSFQAIVTMHFMHSQSMIPTDSSASIFTEGLLGSNYVSLSPGVENTYLHEGSEIMSTHSALILENLIGQFLFNVKK